MDNVGLPVCIEMCIRALKMESCDGNSKATLCKTISCLLPTDLEAKRACQLTEFLLEPTVDAYYAVETLYNEPDQKLEEEDMPVPNSLRCELLLVFKTQWPFDPEFWDWKTLKRHCLALMGEEASIVSSIDLLNDSESQEGPEDEDAAKGQEDEFRDVNDCFMDATNELKEIMDKREKNREVKKLREKGFISARFRNWQAYMQYCVLCDKEFLGHRIVRHAQTHYKDGLYCCPICLETFKSKETLVPHVASHVKLSCKERLTAMKTNKKLANPKTAAPVIAALKAKTENQLCKKENGDAPEQNREFPETVQVSQFKRDNIAENTCPVGNCRKGFKFLKNLLAHVKAHGDNDEAKRFLEMQSRKVICQYCRRQFVNVTHLNDHLQVHCGIRPYICIQLNCKASFLSNTELIVHRKGHAVFKARCMFPSCGKIFNEAYKLYDHEAQHYNTFTCKVPDCGKVLRSQAQLDSHQAEHITKEEECPATEVQSPQSPDPLHSLVERMLSDQAPFKQEVCQGDFLNSVSETSLELDSVGMSCSLESMLKSHGPVQSSEQYVVKSEPPDKELYPSRQVPCSNNSVIRSTLNVHMSDPNQRSHIESSGAPTFDYMRPAPLFSQLPPFQGTGQNLQHVLQTNVLQSQAPTFLQDGNDGSGEYNADCGVSLPGQHQDMCVNELLAVGPTPNYTPSAVSQTLPPAEAPLPPTGVTMPELSCPITTIPTTDDKPRHNCPFETCLRDYSSYRSVTKHMKSLHPEFYAQWKLFKRNPKVSPTPALSTPLVVNTVAALQNQQINGVPVPVLQRQNVIQSHAHLNVGANSSLPSCSSQSSSIALSEQVENILDPIVLSQLGNTPDQFAAMQPWHPTPGNNQTQNSCPSQGYTPDLQGIHIMPQMDAISGAVSHGPPGRHMFGSNTGGSAVRRPSVVKGLQPTLPSYMGSGKGSGLSNELGSSAPVCKSETETNPSSKVTAPKAVRGMVNRKKMPSANALVRTDGVTNPGNYEKFKNVRKRNKRTKWPAIIKDGKYICSRCFREFQSPKSLGGHLSKRSHCKAFDETELAADLPTSFLDLLNSEQSANTPQPPPSELYNPPADYDQDEPSQPVTGNPPDAKCLPNVSYPQANLSAYGIGEQGDDLLKQIMDQSDIPVMFDDLDVHQPSFHNSCGPYGVTERAPENSVIQHTGNLKVKTENESYADPYLQSCDTLFGGSDFSDPLISQILSEKIPTASASSLPSDHINHLPQTEILTEMNEEKMNADYSNSRGQANDVLLTAMAGLTPNLMSNPMTQIMSPDPQCSPTTGIEPVERQRKTIEQDVRKKLREQILAGDFQRRHSSTHSANTETNASSNILMSLNPASNLVQHSGDHQSHQSSKKNEATTVIHDISKVIHLAPPGQIHGPPNPQSFTHFREPSSRDCDTPATASILENDIDLGPSHSSANQHWFIEIQTALEKLDLYREVCDNPQPCLPMTPSGIDMPHAVESLGTNLQPHLPTTPSGNEMPHGIESLGSNLQTCLPTTPSGNDMQHRNETLGSNLSGEKVPQASEVFLKPFLCEQDNCTYRAMTKDAVLKHLMKTHNFTGEMINSMKKNQKFAPFNCQMCSKTFTRNSNLRAHCQSAHRLTPEEVSKLNPKRNSSGFIVNNQDQPSAGVAPAIAKLIPKRNSAGFVVNSLDQPSAGIAPAISKPNPKRKSAGFIVSNQDQPSAGVAPAISKLNPKRNSSGFVVNNQDQPSADVTPAISKLNPKRNSAGCIVNNQNQPSAGVAPAISKPNPKRKSAGFNVNNQDQPSAGVAPAISKPIPKRNSAGFFVNRTKQVEDQLNRGAVTAQAVIFANSPDPLIENITRQYLLQDMIKQERTSQPLELSTSADTATDQISCDAPLSSFMGLQPVERIPKHNTPVPTMSGYLMNPLSSDMTPEPLKVDPGTEQWSHGQNLPASTVPTQNLPSQQQAGVQLPARTSSKSNTPSDALQTTSSPPLEKLPNKQKMMKPKIEKPKIEPPKKMKEKKPELNDAFSPYRPYRCVHQGCVAAFTIQHNLILHYRAVHQSTLSAFEASNENDQNEGQDEAEEPEESSSPEEPEGEDLQVTEFRCQVKDCSRVFQDVPSVLQHYLQLHKFSLDRAGSLMSSINLGRFRCDQHGCAVSFTAIWKYIGHVQEKHEKGKVSKVEPVDGMFRCDVDSCDRAYATRSNLLRHTMKKHHDIYKLQLMNQQQKNEERVKIPKSSDGKENIESNKKIAPKGDEVVTKSDKKKTDKSKSNHWTKYGKPSLKTKDEASALCIKKYTLQYPCMIKGCETVMNSERSIMKHYMGHGLSEKYLEEQRSHFIFCKKSSRRRYRSVRSDDSKSEKSSEISAAGEETETGPEGSDYEYKKPVLRKRVTTHNPELFDSKPSNEDSSEPISDSSVVIKRKRGRQRKLHPEKTVKRKRVARSTKSTVAYQGDNGSDSSSSAAQIQDGLTNFKPMGFEMSFLKFLEESDQSKQSLKRKIQEKTAKVCKKSKAHLHSKDSCVQFRNPQELTSLNNVKIIVDGAYSDVTDLLLKQLQEMRPTVILEK